MPKTKSAKKAHRQSDRRHAKNLARSASLKRVIKNYKKLVSESKKEEASKKLSEVYKTLDKMQKIGFIKKGNANRTKSRLTKKLAK